MAKRKGQFTKDDPRINRDGRPPKDVAITDLLRKKAELEVEPGKTYDDAIAEKLLQLAAEGDLTAIKHYWDRRWGTPKQTQEISMAASLSIDTEFDIVDPDEVSEETISADKKP